MSPLSAAVTKSKHGEKKQKKNSPKNPDTNVFKVVNRVCTPLVISNIRILL